MDKNFLKVLDKAIATPSKLDRVSDLIKLSEATLRKLGRSTDIGMVNDSGLRGTPRAVALAQMALDAAMGRAGAAPAAAPRIFALPTPAPLATTATTAPTAAPTPPTLKILRDLASELYLSAPAGSDIETFQRLFSMHGIKVPGAPVAPREWTGAMRTTAARLQKTTDEFFAKIL